MPDSSGCPSSSAVAAAASAAATAAAAAAHATAAASSAAAAACAIFRISTSSAQAAACAAACAAALAPATAAVTARAVATCTVKSAPPAPFTPGPGCDQPVAASTASADDATEASLTPLVSLPGSSPRSKPSKARPIWRARLPDRDRCSARDAAETNAPGSALALAQVLPAAADGGPPPGCCSRMESWRPPRRRLSLRAAGRCPAVGMPPAGRAGRRTRAAEEEETLPRAGGQGKRARGGDRGRAATAPPPKRGNELSKRGCCVK